MTTVFVVQYTTHEHPFMHLVYAVTEDAEDAITLAETLQNYDDVAEAGFEEVRFFKREIEEEI